MLIDVGLILGTGLLMYELSESFLSHLGGPRNCFKDDYVLVIGHTKGLFKTPIMVDMRATPHLLCCGLSGQGKSRCIEYAIKDKDVILLNAFKDDFKAVKARKIIGNENILHFLENIIKEPYNTLNYIVCPQGISKTCHHAHSAGICTMGRFSYKHWGRRHSRIYCMAKGRYRCFAAATALQLYLFVDYLLATFLF